MPRPRKPLVRVPTEKTLRRYGLTSRDWLVILKRQGGVCFVCSKVPPSGRLNTDHEHVKGWKKLPPEERRRYVRGILCPWCNGKLIGWRVTLAKAEALVIYLRDYHARNGHAPR